MPQLSPYRIRKIIRQEQEHAFEDLQQKFEKDAIVPKSPFLIMKRYAAIFKTFAELLIGFFFGMLSLIMIYFIVVKILHL